LKIFLIPDTQCKPDVPTSHLEAAGNYIADKQPDVIVHLGDHWDMSSLSEYDRGKKCYEGRTYKADVEAGNDGIDLLHKGINRLNRNRKKSKVKSYSPRMEFLIGNHEQRIERVIELDRKLEGTIGYHNFNLEERGWRINPFLKPLNINEIYFAHYFHPPNSSNPYGGTASSKLSNIGFSFVMGHQQGLDVAMKNLINGRTLRGLVAGSFYQHEEKYKGPQRNNHWRGALMLHEVADGNYNLLEISLSYLLGNYL